MTMRQDAISSAKQIFALEPVFLDTETTGLKQSDEVIEIAIVDINRQTLLDTLVRPNQPIPIDATRINAITNEMVRGAPFWFQIWPQITTILRGKIVIAYNANFDEDMMKHSNLSFRIPWQKSWTFFDLLTLYSKFRGAWSSFQGKTKYYSLDEARRSCGIPLPNAHRAKADTLLAYELFLFIKNST